jgi:hypothetical protein
MRTYLDRLGATTIISACDPDIVAARIKRADRWPQGWNLGLSLELPRGEERLRTSGSPVAPYLEGAHGPAFTACALTGGVAV